MPEQIEASTSSSPRANPWNLNIFCAQRVGNLTKRPSRSGEFDLCQSGVGKIEQEKSGFK